MPQVGASTDSASSNSQAPPPLPPRPDAVNDVVTRSPYSYGAGIGSSYGLSPYGIGSSPYGMFGGYGSPYGAYGGYGAYGRGTYGDATGGSDFIRLAEESSRQAFQSIESIVQAFG